MFHWLKSAPDEEEVSREQIAELLSTGKFARQRRRHLMRPTWVKAGRRAVVAMAIAILLIGLWGVLGS